MEDRLQYALRANFPEEMISGLGEIFAEAASATEERLPRLEQALAKLLAEEKQKRRFFLQSAPGGRIHLVYLSGGLYLLTVRGFQEIMWEALLYEGDWSVTDVRWVERESLLLFSLEDIVHGEIQKCLCCYEPGDSFLVTRPWRPTPGEDRCI